MFDKICLILVIIGALNWGLVGLFEFDLVAWAFGGATAVISRIIYTVIALAGIWCISLLFREEPVAKASNWILPSEPSQKRRLGSVPKKSTRSWTGIPLARKSKIFGLHSIPANTTPVPLKNRLFSGFSLIMCFSAAHVSGKTKDAAWTPQK